MFILLSPLALVLPRVPRLSALTQDACRSIILLVEALELRKISKIYFSFSTSAPRLVVVE